ncbi:MAG TPA: 3'-5' exonuclease, partial [Edaphobacter sp.]|nr:3'-5' exonuclease [Edaphobacter sp.]
EEACERLRRIWPILQAAIGQRLRISLSQLVERTWRSLGGDLPLTPEERSNARMYFSLLDEMERRSTVDPAELGTRLGSLYAETPANPGAVDLMTIHGAKGLEWDLVLIPALERKSGLNSARLLTWNEITNGGEHSVSVLLAPIAGKGEDSDALNKWLNSIQNVREQAEARRVFYVACTRAREELHLFASPEQKKNGDVERKAGSLLHAAWAAAKPHFYGDADSSLPSNSVLSFPNTTVEDTILTSLAATSDEPKGAILNRLPTNVSPAKRRHPVIHWKAPSTTPAAGISKRPEGSFAARALGTTVHAFMELLADQLASGRSSTDVLLEIETWKGRIATILRSQGLSPRAAQERTGEVKAALNSALKDPIGLWILEAHKDAFSEKALTAWQDDPANLRIDRVFRAGPEPLLSGNSCLWIVDYKTTSCTNKDVEEFLSREQEKYSAQLETYGRTMLANGETNTVMLGLYYPLVPAFRWWKMPPL